MTLWTFACSGMCVTPMTRRVAHGIKAPSTVTGSPTNKQATQYDPCYHAACDTLANNSNHALAVNSDAVAFAVLTYAFSTETVNGVPGIPVPGDFVLPAPAGPEGTVGSGGGAEADEHLPSS